MVDDAGTSEIERLAGVGVSVLERWTFLVDNLPEDIGGGYFTGEFLLCSNGIVLTRTVSNSSTRDETRWRAGDWKVMPTHPRYSSPASAAAGFKSRGYELFPSSPVAIDAREAGPFPGPPSPSRRL